MTAPADTGLAMILFIAAGLGVLIGIAIYVWYAFALSRLFPRIDGEGWKGWVPVLNEAEILARGGVPAWSVVFYFIPLVQIYGLYLKVVATHRINNRFGHGAGMTVLAILLPPVWATVLAGGVPPYPDGDRLADRLPGSHRPAQPSAAPARDASGYTIPSLSPSGTAPSGTVHAESPPLLPTYAPPPANEPDVAAVEPAPSARFAPPPLTPVRPPASPAPVPPASAPPAPVPPPAPAPSPGSPAPVPPAPDPAPEQAHPPTGIMATMTGAVAVPQPVPEQAPEPEQPAPVPEPPAPPADAEPVASVDEPRRVVRSVPPSFRDGEIQDAEPRMSMIRPAPENPPSGAAEAAAAAAAQPAVTQSRPTPEVDATVVVPRPTDDDLGATVVVARKPGVRRVLVLDDGRRFSLSGASVVIGRNPAGDPGEQRLAISDSTRTLSKTHARLVVHDDEWRLTDLHATNGVVIVADDGAETLLDSGESVIGTGRFILGAVGMQVVAERDS